MEHGRDVLLSGGQPAPCPTERSGDSAGVREVGPQHQHNPI